MKVKNWIPISVIAGVVLGFAAFIVADYAGNSTPFYWAGGVLVGSFVVGCLIGYFSQGRR